MPVTRRSRPACVECGRCGGGRGRSTRVLQYVHPDGSQERICSECRPEASQCGYCGYWGSTHAVSFYPRQVCVSCLYHVFVAARCLDCGSWYTRYCPTCVPVPNSIAALVARAEIADEGIRPTEAIGGGISIRHYGYAPSRMPMHGNIGRFGQTPYLGVELEVDHVPTSALRLFPVSDESEWYVTRDGSVHSGWEATSCPHTHAEIIRRDIFAPFRDIATEYPDAVSYSGNDSSCGLHVHFSRCGIGKLARLKLYRWAASPNGRAYITMLSRRKPHNLRDWAPLPYADIPMRDIISRIKRDASPDGQRGWLNLTTRRQTWEFRFPNGTLSYPMLVGCVSMLAALVDWARCASLRAVNSQAFEAWLMTQPERAYPYARLYIGRAKDRALAIPRFVAPDDYTDIPVSVDEIRAFGSVPTVAPDKVSFVPEK